MVTGLCASHTPVCACVCTCLQEAMSRPVSVSDVRQELLLRGGLLPLMHLYPNESTHPGWLVGRSVVVWTTPSSVPGILPCPLSICLVSTDHTFV